MARTRCSFCGKHEDQVRHLVAGPNGVAICDECVNVCVEVQGAGLEFEGDLLLTGIGELTTNDRFVPGLLGTIHNAAVAVRGGIVRWAGPQLALPDKYLAFPTLECGGRAVIPGFVDAHTHALFGGEQADRFMRLGSGGTNQGYRAEGTSTTIETTRATSDQRLSEEVSTRLANMLAHGTTTVEVKSGYGGDAAGERRLLELAHRLDGELAIDIVSTVLTGARIPGAMTADEYAGWVVDELIPMCAPLASYADVVSDELGPGEVETILAAASAHGLAVRAHVARYAGQGEVSMAIRQGAVSVDHLDHLGSDELRQLANSPSVAVLLPTTGFGAGRGKPPARQIWDAGVTVAIASDCNPVDSYVESMQLVIATAVSGLGLTVEESVWAATRGGALALEEPEKGWIARGTFGDLVVLDAPSMAHLAYRPGINLAWRVLKDGVLVAS